MLTKICIGCKQDKSIDDFRLKKDGKYGRQPRCKPCQIEWNREYNNRPEVKEVQSVKTKLYRKEFFSKEENKLKQRQRCKSHYYRNTEQYRARDYRRRNVQSKCTPSWLTQEQLNEMKQVYWLASDLKAVTGESYHVDHIVPVNGVDFCGLNVPWNLQILPWDINISKGNRYSGEDAWETQGY